MVPVQARKMLLGLLVSLAGARAEELAYPPGSDGKPAPVHQSVHPMGQPLGNGVRYYVGLSDSLLATDPLARALSASGEGPPVLECAYGGASGFKYAFYFWYKNVPQDLITQDKSGYLRWYGIKPLEKCPGTLDEAREARKANTADRGFPR